ncbi:phospholipase D-like domain-containing protein [Carboxylicivirga marina]|uniref:phospholipase D-like domain-containing protein n=1 Tax=Carboxylicivirga marina TaxID=2800988 RepID=UPI002592098D|nr:phospholipase D-like domain-containing protein [uncultured Carboxylicivirga sp.]
MNEIIEELEKSIDDFVLSKLEKKIISAKLDTKDFGKYELLKLRTHLFKIAKDKCTDRKHKNLINWLEEANIFLLPDSIEPFYCRSYFSPGSDCLMTIIKQLNKCTTSADICVFTISDDRIRDEIVSAINRGIKVRIISDDDKTMDRGSDMDYLSDNGAEVKIDHSPHHMHHKFAIFDSKVLLTGSYNWTRSASEFNQENIIETNNTEALEKYIKEFERLWNLMYKLHY